MKATVKRCNIKGVGCHRQSTKTCMPKSDKISVNIEAANQGIASNTESEIQYSAPNVLDVIIDFNFGRPTLCKVECRGVVQGACSTFEPYFDTIEAALAMGRCVPTEHLVDWRRWRKEQNEKYAGDLVNAAIVLGCDLLRIRYATAVSNAELQRYVVVDFQQRLKDKANQKGIRVMYPEVSVK